jgi:hypothetical protein
LQVVSVYLPAVVGHDLANYLVLVI